MSVVEAEGGPQALSLLRAGMRKGERFDLAILDMMMPGMSGIDLAKLIKGDADLTDLPMIMLTSINWEGDRGEAREAGISTFLTKPTRASELYDELAKVLVKPHERLTSEEESHAGNTAKDSGSRRFCHRILLAEDNLVNQEVAKEFLKELGCEVETVATGKAVLDALQQSTFDLVLMDCQMPEMDGLEATRLIRERERLAGGEARTPIVALTANAFEKDREECLASVSD